MEALIYIGIGLAVGFLLGFAVSTRRWAKAFLASYAATVSVAIQQQIELDRKNTYSTNFTPRGDA
jgi:multisubunit Na+/H+ antiporter MnhB subunit